MCFVCLQSYRMESTADEDDLFDHELRPPRMIPLANPPLQKSSRKLIQFETPIKKLLHVELAKEVETKSLAASRKASSKNRKEKELKTTKVTGKTKSAKVTDFKVKAAPLKVSRKEIPKIDVSNVVDYFKMKKMFDRPLSPTETTKKSPNFTKTSTITSSTNAQEPISSNSAPSQSHANMWTDNVWETLTGDINIPSSATSQQHSPHSWSQISSASSIECADKLGPVSPNLTPCSSMEMELTARLPSSKIHDITPASSSELSQDYEANLRRITGVTAEETRHEEPVVIGDGVDTEAVHIMYESDDQVAAELGLIDLR